MLDTVTRLSQGLICCSRAICDHTQIPTHPCLFNGEFSIVSGHEKHPFRIPYRGIGSFHGRYTDVAAVKVFFSFLFCVAVLSQHHHHPVWRSDVVFLQPYGARLGHCRQVGCRLNWFKLSQCYVDMWTSAKSFGDLPALEGG